jgi:hypothetical protein
MRIPIDLAPHVKEAIKLFRNKKRSSDRKIAQQVGRLLLKEIA